MILGRIFFIAFDFTVINDNDSAAEFFYKVMLMGYDNDSRTGLIDFNKEFHDIEREFGIDITGRFIC